MADFDIDPPQVWYVWDGEKLYMPDGGVMHPPGSREMVDRIVDANKDRCYQAVQMEVTFAEEGHECVWEHTHSEPTWGAHYECKICGGKTP